MHNSDLIGKPGGRALMATPALILDRAVFEQNLADMAAFAKERNIALRPHTKTHKCVEIAKRQLALGVKGICTAKVAEAEAMAAGGIGNILVTSPQVTDQAFARLIALTEKCEDLMAVVDHPDCAARMGAAAQAAGVTLNLLVDLNVGTFRTGIRPGQASTALAKAVDDHPNLTFRGFQAYAGHTMHIEDFEDRKAATAKSNAKMMDAVTAAREVGLDPEILTGGGTGTFDLDEDLGGLNELQVGSYIFMDVEYCAVQGRLAGRPQFGNSLFVQTTVISANNNGFVTTDAGFKSFAMDGPLPEIHAGAPDGASYMFMGDEHGGVRFAGEDDSLDLGAVVTVTNPHCDPTVNLYDMIHVVDGDQLVDIWPIEGRGKSW